MLSPRMVANHGLVQKLRATLQFCPCCQSYSKSVAKPKKKRSRILKNVTERFEASTAYKGLKAQALNRLPKEQTPEVTEPEWNLIRKCLKLLPDDQKPLIKDLKAVQRRVFLLKSLGVPVSSIPEAPTVLCFSEGDILKRSKKIFLYSLGLVKKVTAPLLVGVTHDNHHYTTRRMRSIKFDAKGEHCLADYMKIKLRISEEELINLLNQVFFRTGYRRLYVNFDEKLDLLSTYNFCMDESSGNLQFVINPHIDAKTLHRRLWHLWYRNIDPKDFPAQLLNSTSDERFYIMLDLYLQQGSCSIKHVLEIFERDLLDKQSIWSVWGLQFFKMNSAQGQANMIYLTDKGFHFQDIIGGMQALNMNLRSLSEVTTAITHNDIDPSALKALSLKTKSVQDFSSDSSLAICQETYLILCNFLGWTYDHQKCVLGMGTQPIELLLKNYTFLRHVGFSEIDLQQAPVILSHNQSDVIHKVEEILRYGSEDDQAFASDNVLLLNYVQYQLEQKFNFRFV